VSTASRGVVVLVVALGAAAWLRHWRTKDVSSVQRGFALAERKGCFTCHGPGGLAGIPSPGHGLGDVPPFAGGLIHMYAESEAEILEWILDGLPRRIRDDPAQLRLRENATVRMPAWRGELHDLVAYVKAVSDFELPDDPAAEQGRQVAKRFGCFNCHGPQGRGSMPNVRAFKGYIPAWDGEDFPVLARDDREIRLWILDGGTRRLWANPLTRWFLERQPIVMPAYRGHISEREVERLIDYIHWLRAGPRSPPAAPSSR
jgi:mono/diheme cytochrome c family protein